MDPEQQEERRRQERLKEQKQEKRQQRQDQAVKTTAKIAKEVQPEAAPFIEAAEIAYKHRDQGKKLIRYLIAGFVAIIFLFFISITLIFVIFFGDNASASCSSELVGSVNAEKAYNYFIQKGLQSYQAAGILGNLQQESGIDPTDQQDKSHDPFPKPDVGFGIAQWTPSTRQQGLVDLANKEGKPVTDLGVQLDYLWQELSGGYGGALDALKATSNVDDATTVFEQKFEAAGDPRMDNRLKAAHYYLDKYGDGATVGSPGDSGCTVGSVDGYKNPVRDVKPQSGGRIDQGVDFGGAGPVYALGNGKVVNIYSIPGWGGSGSKLGGVGAFINIQLSDGPAAGKYYYTAENCTPQVSVGDTVTPDTVICTLIDHHPNLEIGWSDGGGSDDLAAAKSVYKEGFETAYGVNMNQLLTKLGAPKGTLDTTNDPQGEVLGDLPDGWPQW